MDASSKQPPEMKESPAPLSRKEFLKKAGLAAGVLAAGPAAASTFSTILNFHKPPGTFRGLAETMNTQIVAAQWGRSECAGVRCTLCPYGCFLSEGERGHCHVRANQSGRLVSLVYGAASAVHVDPIEKKPVFHLYPGSRAFSIATVGCNLRCSFCQNWELSQTFPEEASGIRLLPREVVAQARAAGCRSIAYTYSEPMVFYEYVYDTAKIAKESGLRNVVVSAGYVNREPLKEMAPLLDVMKVDLKGFNEAFYRKTVGGELKFVLNTLQNLAAFGVFTEIVNLVVPTLNDDLREIRKMCRWIKSELGPEVPLFFSRFTPQYQLQNLPPTPLSTLREARHIGLEEGLHYVYTGNVPGDEGENTYCPTCKKVLIERYGYLVKANRLAPGGLCPYDKTPIPGIWEESGPAGS